jgi:16S rRNA (cytosine967-C5)-methyltransferase
MSAQKPREIALRVLSRQMGGAFLEQRLDLALASSGLSPADRHLCQELAYGVVRWQAALDWLIARKTGARPQKPILLNVLRLGLYQIFWLERIPNHAAVHESVELARSSGSEGKSGFVNAVLRGYLREFDATRQLLEELKISEPHIGFSHPQWLAARWRERWGPDAAAKLMGWNNTPPKVFARVNTLKTDAAQLLARWQAEAVECEAVRRDWLPEGIVFELKSSPALSQLRSFQEGWFYAQDPSTLLAVHELNPEPGENMLDLCAAPGGKLTYIAQIMRNQGRLIAHDTAPDRMRLIKQNCARLGVTCVQAALPGSPLLTPPSALFDRVLLDAPCSNTGVMRRRVEVRWRIRPTEIQRLSEQQTVLLRRAAALVKPGGTLVYSTCSLEPEENQDVVKGFLAEHEDFTPKNERLLLPFEDSLDGAYVARITRKEDSNAAEKGERHAFPP